jgi:hypothetical protein
VTDIIVSGKADTPLASKNELLAAIENGDPDLNLMVEMSTLLFNAMLFSQVDANLGIEHGYPGGVDGADGGDGAAGDAGDGAVFSPIPEARCDFALELEGEVLFDAALEDLRDGKLDRPDLAGIKAQVDEAMEDPQMQQAINATFDKWFPGGIGKPYSEIADEDGRYFLPIPHNLQGFVRCSPPDQPQLRLATLIPMGPQGLIRTGQDVTPATTFFSHSVAAELSGDLSTVKENFLNDIEGLGDIDIVTDGDEITEFKLLSDDNIPNDEDVGLVAFSATALYNILYKNEANVDFMTALDDFFDEQSVNSALLETLGVPTNKAFEWAKVVNTSNSVVASKFSTDLGTALTKARINVRVAYSSQGDVIPKAEVTVSDAPGAIQCQNCPKTTDEKGLATLDLTGVPSEGTVVVVKISNVDGFEDKYIKSEVVAFATVDLNVFMLAEYQLSVTKPEQGKGTVTSKPSGIKCGTDCKEKYPAGTKVLLDANAEAGSYFKGWKGDPDCSDGKVTMDSDIGCSAYFYPIPQHGLAVIKTGKGDGLVTSSPSGINCGADCKQYYKKDTVVSLTVEPDKGSDFKGWSGNFDCLDGKVTMKSDLTCTAIFDLVIYPRLNVEKTGEGRGTVFSDPSGINCGADCDEIYKKGTKVSLKPKPDGDSVFNGFSGDVGCASGVVIMDSHKTCTARFEPIKVQLGVIKDGKGEGTVTSYPSGIECGQDCYASYKNGTVVKLTATPFKGSNFIGWSGDTGCSWGQVTMDTDKNCTATFGLSMPPIIGNIYQKLLHMNDGKCVSENGVTYIGTAYGIGFD